jgi:AcrR family transcriptional regulator
MTTSMSATDAPERKPGRPRSARAHQAILDATLQLLAEEGYRGLSLEQVAARAGVGKTTIYRRWSSKQDLVIEAVTQITRNPPIVETGNVRADLLTALRDSLAAMPSITTQVLLRLVGEMGSTPELFRAFMEQAVAPDILMSVQLIQHGQARGEIRADLDPLLVMGLLAGPVLMWLFTGQAMSADIAERTLDAVWNGIAVRPEQRMGTEPGG